MQSGGNGVGRMKHADRIIHDINACTEALQEQMRVEMEVARAVVSEIQSVASDIPRLHGSQLGGQIRCAGCGSLYEDTPSNFCSFCVQ